jgi:hypothetical protein
MIIGCLGRLGVLSKTAVQNYEYSSSTQQNRSYNYISDNRYEREMFPKSAYNSCSQKKIVNNPHPAWTNPPANLYRPVPNVSFPHSSYRSNFTVPSMGKHLPSQQSHCYSSNHRVDPLNSSLTSQSVKHSYHPSRPPRILYRPSQIISNPNSLQENYSTTASLSFTPKTYPKSQVFKKPSQTITTSSRPPWKKKN